MKKAFLTIITICICSLFVSCTQATPNYDRFVPYDNNARQEMSAAADSGSSAPTPGIPDASAEITTDVLTVNYMGLGYVKYRVLGIELTNIPPDDKQSSNTKESYLLISFEIENIDVSPEEEMAKNGLANCFGLYPNDPAEIADANIIWISEPDYFSDASESSDEKSYFRYSIPDIGDTKTFVLGWTLDNFGIQLLKQNKLCLTCVFAENLSMPVIYDVNTED